MKSHSVEMLLCMPLLLLLLLLLFKGVKTIVWACLYWIRHDRNEMHETGLGLSQTAVPYTPSAGIYALVYPYILGKQLSVYHTQTLIYVSFVWAARNYPICFYLRYFGLMLLLSSYTRNSSKGVCKDLLGIIIGKNRICGMALGRIFTVSFYDNVTRTWNIN